MLVEHLVAIAQVKLKEQPFDGIHNLDHHAKVWANCEAILLDEELTDLDRDVLQVACWWHDVDRGEESSRKLVKVLQNGGAQLDFSQRVDKVVSEHTFGTQQTCPESQILYDADKLEYLSMERFNDLMKMSEEKFKHYISAWQERISNVWENLHFPSARKEFIKRYEEISEFAKEYPNLLKSIKATGLDFSEYQLTE